MARVKLWMDRRSALVDGGYPLKIRVTAGGKSAYLSTGIRLMDGQWDGRAECVVGGRRKVAERVAGIRFGACEALADIRLSGKESRMSAGEIADVIRIRVLGQEARPSPDGLLLVQMERYRDSCRSAGTAELYGRTIAALAAFDPGLGTRALDDVGRGYLEGFARSCGRTMSVNTVSILMRNIRAVFNASIRDGLTDNYPFRAYRIRQEETRKRSLPVEGLRLLAGLECGEGQEKYRDYFMLMFFLIGINAADLFNAKPDDLEAGRLHYRRKKTGKLYSVKVEPEAMEIIDKYRGRRHLLEAMDVYSDFRSWRTKLDQRLKALGQVTGKRGKVVSPGPFPGISTYWARHTWATVAYGLGIPVDIIGQALGHSDRAHAVTYTYIRPDGAKVDEANRMVIDHVLGKI